MKWIADATEPRQLHLVIERQLLKSLIAGRPDEYGYYLRVYENNKGLLDDLQDTLEWAMTVAEEDFGVPKNAWRKVE